MDCQFQTSKYDHSHERPHPKNVKGSSVYILMCKHPIYTVKKIYEFV